MDDKQQVTKWHAMAQVAFEKALEEGRGPDAEALMRVMERLHERREALKQRDYLNGVRAAQGTR